MDQPATNTAPTRDLALLALTRTKTGKTATGEFVRRAIRELSRHVGGNPSCAQSLLIGRAAWLLAHLAALDEAAMRNGKLSHEDAAEYASLNSALAGLLSLLGLRATLTTTEIADPPGEVAA